MTQQSHFWIYLHRKWKQDLKEIFCTTMFTAELCTTAKIWKKFKCPSMDEWIKQILFSHKKKENLAVVLSWGQFWHLEGVQQCSSISRDLFGSNCQSSTDIKLKDVQDSAKHSTLHRTNPPNQELSSPKCHQCRGWDTLEQGKAFDYYSKSRCNERKYW